MKLIFAKTVIAAVAGACALGASAHALALPLEELPAPKPAKTTLNHPDWSRNAVIYEVNWRQMTPEGTFKGVEGQLPRLKDLGVDILWLMPIHPISVEGRKGELGSYYAAADYKQVNPEAGTVEDLRHLVKAAHDMGMKVIIDWVPNHTGNDHWWTVYHPEYYVLDENGKPASVGDWTDISKLDYGNPAVREAMFDSMAFWIREADIDGFRCDVAFAVPTDFWNETRPRFDALKPGLFFLAEASEPTLQEHAFDMGYNWPMAVLFRQIAKTSGQNTFQPDVKEEAKQAADIEKLLAQQAATYPGDTYMMNMVTNHDFNSWEGTEFERFGNLTEAMAVLTYTLPGMPLIYTGQETGMNRAFEFFKKDTAPDWEPRNGFFTFYQKLNALKHTEAALLAGEAGAPVVSYPLKSKDLIAFSRTKGDSEIMVLANLGATEQKVKFEGKAPMPAPGMTDFSTGAPAKLPAKLAPGEYRLFVRR